MYTENEVETVQLLFPYLSLSLLHEERRSGKGTPFRRIYCSAFRKQGQRIADLNSSESRARFVDARPLKSSMETVKK